MIHVATLGLYIVACLLWLRSLLGRDGEGVSVAAGWVAASGVAAHLLALIGFVLRWDQLPLVGLAPSLSTLAFLMGLGLLLTLTLGEASRVGILLVPFMTLLEGTALLIGIEPAPGTLDFRGAWFALHVTLALASVGAVAVAAAAGGLYLFQFRELKSRRLGRAFHFLPPLATLDRVLRAGLLTGFCTLTLALLLGWAWTYGFRGSFEVGDPKTLWAIFVWVVVTGALVVRTTGRSEKRGALGSVVAFGLIVVSYLLVRGPVGGSFFL